MRSTATGAYTGSASSSAPPARSTHGFLSHVVRRIRMSPEQRKRTASCEFRQRVTARCDRSCPPVTAVRRGRWDTVGTASLRRPCPRVGLRMPATPTDERCSTSRARSSSRSYDAAPQRPSPSTGFDVRGRIWVCVNFGARPTPSERHEGHALCPAERALH